MMLTTSTERAQPTIRAVRGQTSSRSAVSARRSQCNAFCASFSHFPTLSSCCTLHYCLSVVIKPLLLWATIAATVFIIKVNVADLSSNEEATCDEMLSPVNSVMPALDVILSQSPLQQQLRLIISSISIPFASAQPQPAALWGFNVSDPAGPLNWGTVLNTDGDILYPSCVMDNFPAPRRFHDVHLVNNGAETSGLGVELSSIRLDYLASSHYKVEVKNAGQARPTLVVTLLDVQCTTHHPINKKIMALQRIEFLVPAENEMGYINSLEVHLVHAELDSTNTPIPSNISPEFVIAVFFDGVITGGTPEMTKILARAPQNGVDGSVEVTDWILDPALLFPSRHDYIFFRGVVPKPPCDVSAHYALLVQNMYVSTAQMQTIRNILFGPRLADDPNQRNSALVHIRNKAALTAKKAEKHTYFVALKKDFPLVKPPKREPLGTETKIAIAGFIFGALSGLVGLTAIIFSLCRPRTRLTKKDEAQNLAAAAAAVANKSATTGQGNTSGNANNKNISDNNINGDSGFNTPTNNSPRQPSLIVGGGVGNNNNGWVGNGRDLKKILTPR